MWPWGLALTHLPSWTRISRTPSSLSPFPLQKVVDWGRIIEQWGWRLPCTLLTLVQFLASEFAMSDS